MGSPSPSEFSKIFATCPGVPLCTRSVSLANSAGDSALSLCVQNAHEDGFTRATRGTDHVTVGRYHDHGSRAAWRPCCERALRSTWPIAPQAFRQQRNQHEPQSDHCTLQLYTIFRFLATFTLQSSPTFTPLFLSMDPGNTALAEAAKVGSEAAVMCRQSDFLRTPCRMEMNKLFSQHLSRGRINF